VVAKEFGFEDRWAEKIHEIKKICLTPNQSVDIFENFRSELAMSLVHKRISAETSVRIIVDLKLALIQANNNYKKEFPSFWDRFSKLKLPNIDINAIKRG